MKLDIKKSLLFAFTLVLIALCSSGCSNDIDGDWDVMKWKKEVPKKVKVNGASCYHIPIQGRTCQFNCKNYSSFWISHVRILGTPAWKDWNVGDYIYPEKINDFMIENQNISADGFKVSIQGNTMNVIFDENNSFTKYIEVVVSAGDIFDTFRFVQDSPLYTENN